MKNQFIILCLALGFCSCSSTNLMTLSVKEPAPVSISPDIKVVAVVDRSHPSQDNKTVDAIHRTLSLESAQLQQDGVKASMEGLSDELMKNSRFTQVVPLTSVQLFSTGAGIFPYPLSWDTVDSICKNSHTDALFALELFDAATKLNPGATSSAISNAVRSISTVPTRVNINTSVKIGWRIYDPSSRTILDEYIVNRDINSSVNAFNPARAVSTELDRKESVKKVGNMAGQAYADRILPYWIRVSRDYFVRGSDGFVIAKRKAQTGDWDGAGEIWNRETTNKNGKIAGRACYNMAIISEINGDLDGAIQWASKAYENHGIRLALTYVNMLKYRKNQNEILKSQDISSNSPRP